LSDFRRITGTLEHAAFVYTDGMSRLPPLYNAMRGFDSDESSVRRISESVAGTLDWWLARLRDTSVTRQLYPLQELRDLGLYVDASTSWGIGLYFDGKWSAFELAPTWKGDGGRDICWLEAVALELLLLFMHQLGLTHGRFRIYSDNMGAIGAHTKGRSSNEHINLCVRRSISFAARHLLVLDFVYVASADNPADPISRGDLGPPSLHIKRKFALPDVLSECLRDAHA
ncbi:hypothetical protein HDZ31DRAFT_48907, partial [Schizophyllum fasciatum]